MSKNKIVTFAIIFLIGLFALLIILTLIPGRRQAAGRPQGGAPQGGAPQGAQIPQGGAMPGGAGRAQASRNASTVRVVPVAPDTIEQSVIINGEIYARNQVTIFPSVSGRVIETYYTVGDRVNRGDTVAMIDPSRPGEVFSRSPVISTVSGTVLQASYSIGDTVTTQSPIFIVGDLSSLIIETHIAERFVATVRQGMRASLQFEAFPGETFTGEVFEISPVLDPASRTLRVRLRFINLDARIRAGMYATISLVINQKINVPVIPRISLINTYGSWIIFVVDDNNIAHRREVTLGIDNEEFVEVLSGAVIGERVVNAGQNFLTDGDLVRIVD